MLGWRVVIYTVLALAPVLAAAAETDLAETDACILERIGAGQDASACIANAQAACQSEPESRHAIAALCLVEARAVWTRGISDLMQKVQETAPEEIAAIAAIEVKYDVLSGLLQCERLDELGRAAGNQSGDALRRARTRCEATVSGLAYMRLRWRTRDLP